MKADMRHAAKRIVVGRIAGVHGVKGRVKIMSYTSPRENILHYTPWQLRLDTETRATAPRDWNLQHKGLVVALEGIQDRDEARRWIGAEISILRSQLKELASGEYYYADLVGMEVINRAGKSLGRVREIMETGANAVLVITGRKRVLVPVVWRRYVEEIDQDAGVIRVDWEESD